MPKRRSVLWDSGREPFSDLLTVEQQRQRAAMRNRKQVRCGVSPDLQPFASVKRRWQELPPASFVEDDPVVLEGSAGVQEDEDLARQVRIAKHLTETEVLKSVLVKEVSEPVFEPVADVALSDAVPDVSSPGAEGEVSEEEADVEACEDTRENWYLNEDEVVAFDAPEPDILSEDLLPDGFAQDSLPEDASVSDLELAPIEPILPHLTSVSEDAMDLPNASEPEVAL